MKVTISGPNPHGGMFHVHKTGCADLTKGVYRRLNVRDDFSEIYEEDHPDVQSVVLSVYDNGIMDEQETQVTYEDYLEEFKFFPCTSELPALATELEVRGG